MNETYEYDEPINENVAADDLDPKWNGPTEADLDTIEWLY
jgi:hypothetical protein